MSTQTAGLLLIAAVLMAFASTARAFGPAMTGTYSYKKETPDGRHVLVMLGGRWSRAHPPGTTPPQDPLAAKYPHSGMYPNDGSAQPLWRFSGYVHPEEVALFSDGIHMVYGVYQASSSDQTVLSFFAHGESIRHYTVKEYRSLTGKPFLDYEVRDVAVDDAAHTLEITDTVGNRFTFDATTGDAIDAHIAWTFDRGNPAIWIGYVVFPLVLLGFGCSIWRHRRAQARSVSRVAPAIEG